MLKNFRTYQLAINLYRECEKVKLPSYLRDQLLRATSSVVLNLAEGSARPTKKDRMRFYYIAFASLREVQGIIDLQYSKLNFLEEAADHIGACMYRLTQS